MILTHWMVISFIYADQHALPFQVPENLIFKANFGIINAGEATLTITEGDSISGHEYFLIQAKITTNSFFDFFYKVRDNLESYWDVEKLLSRKFVKRLSEGSYRQFRIHYNFPEDTLTYYVKIYQDSQKQEELKTLPNPQDPLSSIYWIRLQDFDVGDSIFVNVVADGRNLQTKVTALEKKPMKTIFGNRECFKLHLTSVNEEIEKQEEETFLWVTADEYKVPVKITTGLKVGSFTFELQQAENVDLPLAG
jgi:hypothetical protein